MTDRLPPHDLAAERSVLGAILLDCSVMADVAPVLTMADFYRSSHQAIYGAIWAMWAEGREVDVVTVRDFLARSGALEKAGGDDALHDLADAFPTAANAEHYARIVRDYSTRRQVIHAATEMSRAAYDGEDSPDDLLDASAAKILRIDRGTDQTTSDLAESLGLLVKKWERGERQDAGIPTHLDALNGILGGLRAGEMIVIAGRPSMGKSTLALNCVGHAAIHQKTNCAVFALEMGRDQVTEGMVASEAGVNPRKFRDGLDAEEWQRVASASARFESGGKVEIIDTGRLSPVSLRSSIRRLSARHPLGLVVVDYVQLMDSGTKKENRQQEVTEISRSIKVLAREFSVPIIAVCQLSRAVENRTPPKPRMSDLRESGSLEQDADVVILLYREDYYDPDTENKGIAELNVAKNRSGPTGIARAVFLPHHLRFRDAAKDYGFPL